LAGEVAPFKIRTLLIEAGALATDFADSTKSAVRVASSRPYQGTPADAILDSVSDNEKVKAGAASPQKAALRIIEAVDKTGMLAGREISLRLLLGKEGEWTTNWCKDFLKDAESLKDIMHSISA
jgi:hypothetical protein